MNKIIFFFSLSFFLALQVFSQQKNMTLSVKELNKNKIFLKFDSKTLAGDDISINPDATGWTFEVISALPVKVYIINMVGNTDTLEITNFSKIYQVQNGSVDGKLKLSNSFRISIHDTAGKFIKAYPLEQNSSTLLSAKEDRAARSNPDYIVGSMVHDALYLQKGTNDVFKTKILKHYAMGTSGGGENLPDSSLRKAYSNNPFINNIVPRLVVANSLLDFGTLFSGVGGIPATRIADGLSQFLVDRAKQELSIAFFRKFKKTLEDPRYRDLPTLFPMTADLLLQLEEEIENYERLIDNLREAFKNDIQRIHYNFPGIIKNHHVFFETHLPLKAGLLSACYIAQEADNATHPGDIIANYPLEYLDSLDNNYKGTIQTIQLLNYSFRDTSKGENAAYWVPISSLRELVNDRKAMKIYFGLIYQVARLDYDSIPYQGTSLVQLLDEVAKVYDKGSDVYQRYKVFILKYGEKVDAVTKMIRETKLAGLADSVKVETYIRFVKTTVDLLAYSAELCKLPVIKSIGALADFPSLSKKYFDLAYTAVDLSAAINRKNYSAAINGAISLYAMATTKNPELTSLQAGNNPAAGSTNVSGSQVSATNTDSLTYASDTLERVAVNQQNPLLTADSIKQFAATRGKLLKYGSFMASVASANSAKQVKDIIEKAALPVGSSRIKRAAQFNVAINGYIGGYFGFEKIQKVENKSTLNTFGITAPVGVSVSLGKQLLFWPTKDEWSTSLFVSLIDVGTIAAFRIKDDSTEQIPAIQLKHIFAPGAFLSVGIPKTPLSLNAGWQVGPNLRKIITTPTLQNDYSQYMYTRFAVALVVDIPVFNLYTSD